MSKLFDYEEEFEESYVDPEEIDDDVIEESTNKRDKIFENDYNTGNLDFDEYKKLPSVEILYADEHLRECYDSYEYTRNLNLEKLIDEYFKNTDYGKALSAKKKIPKQLQPIVFVSIREQFKSNEFTETEIFSAIADYFRINYEVLYENIPSVYRAQLVRELDDKYGILKRKKLKRLF